MGEKKYKALKNRYFNENLSDQVKNRSELDKILEVDDHLVQKAGPIFSVEDVPFFKSHFYQAEKKLFGKFVDTFYANIMVLWAMTFLFCITLYFDAFRKLLELSSRLVAKIKRT